MCRNPHIRCWAHVPSVATQPRMSTTTWKPPGGINALADWFICNLQFESYFHNHAWRGTRLTESFQNCLKSNTTFELCVVCTVCQNKQVSFKSFPPPIWPKKLSHSTLWFLSNIKHPTLVESLVDNTALKVELFLRSPLSLGSLPWYHWTLDDGSPRTSAVH